MMQRIVSYTKSYDGTPGFVTLDFNAMGFNDNIEELSIIFTGTGSATPGALGVDVLPVAGGTSLHSDTVTTVDGVAFERRVDIFRPTFVNCRATADNTEETALTLAVTIIAVLKVTGEQRLIDNTSRIIDGTTTADVEYHSTYGG